MRKACGGMRARLVMMRIVNKQSTLGGGNAFTPPKINEHGVLLVAASRDPVRARQWSLLCSRQSVVFVCASALFSPSDISPFKESACVAHPVSSNERLRTSVSNQDRTSTRYLL